jgi:pyridinium-3,5-bisthiocarboxylic acid mononucleotide nickel chelatase
MKICYLDAFSGLSGDMLVGALADAGADAAKIAQTLQSLQTGAEFRFEKTVKRGIGATKFHVTGGETNKHRHLPHILQMIDQAELPGRVKRDASAVFERLGQAEAAVHQVPLERVHFHEVGAVDSIADIVGACLGFELLGVEQIHCSAVNTGSGTVKTEHGILPVPAPATAALLAGKPIYARGPAVELTTPTGAAVAVTLATRFGPPPPMTLAALGYGAGSKDFIEHANVLRVMIGEASGATEATTVSIIEANIDDLSPQILAYTMERLIEGGALDVSFSPVFMKKNRPGTLLRIIARPEDQEKLAQILFAETSTLGARIYSAERRVQDRSIVEVETPHGKVRIKVSTGGNFAPEYEDCRKLASESGAPLKQILAEANLAYLRTQQK